EDTYTINPNWEMQLGAIYTRRTADAEAIGEDVTSLIGKYPEAGSMLNPSIDTFDPQLAIFYKPTSTDTFRASISKKTRFPSFKQVYSNYGAGNTIKCPAGSTTCSPNSNVPSLALQNPGLSPEKALHYELGYLGRPIDSIYLEGSVYYSRSKNTIGRTDRDFITFPGYAITQSINLDGITERKGLDLGMHYDVSPRFALGLSYSYLHMRNKEDSDFRFIDIPRHFGVAYAEIRANDWLKVIPSVEFRGSSYYDTAGEHKNPGYALTNLKLSVTPPSWKYVTASLGVENMFDKNYRAYDDPYPSPGRAYFLNLRIDYR
ncbi:MAG: TonB-dependent receptor domain-containing protein, partial [Pollutimonas bauzanensis]